MNWTTHFKDLVNGYTAITTTHGRSNAGKYSHISVVFGYWYCTMMMSSGYNTNNLMSSCATSIVLCTILVWSQP